MNERFPIVGQGGDRRDGAGASGGTGTFAPAAVVTSLICLTRKRSIPRKMVTSCSALTFPPPVRIRRFDNSAAQFVADPLVQSSASSVEFDDAGWVGFVEAQGEVRASRARFARSARAYRRGKRGDLSRDEWTERRNESGQRKRWRRVAIKGIGMQSTAPAGADGAPTYSTSWFGALASKTALFCGRPTTFLAAGATVVVWGLSGPVFHYSDTWQLVINTGTTIITFLMVFLIQHTQNRDTLALQLKLDELILGDPIGEQRNRRDRGKVGRAARGRQGRVRRRASAAT